MIVDSEFEIILIIQKLVLSVLPLLQLVRLGTLTFPDASGTIATQAYVNSQISAEDLDIEADSGTIAIDLNSEVLDIEGGTNITTAATGNKVTINMPTSFATGGFCYGYSSGFRIVLWQPKFNLEEEQQQNIQALKVLMVKLQ